MADEVRMFCLRHGESENVRAGAAGRTDPATRALTGQVLRTWIVDRDLSARVGDGETGYQVAGRVCAALTSIADAHPGQTVAVVGHVASLTIALNELGALGYGVWGRPLPHTVPFLLVRRGSSWRCPSWPGS